MDDTWIIEMRKLASQAKKLAAEFNDLTKQARTVSQNFRGLANAAKPLLSQFNNITKSIKTIPQGFKKLADTAGPLLTQLKNISKSIKTTSDKFAFFSKTIDKTSANLKRSDSKTSKGDGKNDAQGKINSFANFAKDAFGVISPFLKDSIKISGELEKQRVQLKELAGPGYGQLEKSLRKTADLSKNAFSEKEMMNASAEALKNGASIEFISNSLETFQKIAVVTGKSISDLYSLPEHERKKVFESYTKDQKKASGLQDQYNQMVQSGILAEQRFANSMEKLQGAIGKMLGPLIGPLTDALSSLINYFTYGEVGIKRLQAIMIVFLPLAIGGMLAMAAAGWSAISPWLPLIIILLSVGAVLAGLFLAVDDFIGWMKGEKSVIGDFLGPFSHFKETVINSFKAGINWIMDSFNHLISFFRAYGRLIITLIFPIAGLYLYFDEIKAAFGQLLSWVSDLFSKVWSSLIPDPNTLLNSISAGIGLAPSEKKASGGPVTAGNSYLVGERGPEIFSPGASGRITPNGRIGGGSTSVVIQSVVGTLTVNVSGSAAAGREIKDAVMRALDELSEDVLPAKLGITIN
ncbi:hypothetical protein LEP1GSC058_3105 [Leptospira fainei serovar Hurstbridge str. BUT 6]|uniref:Uncharacterized protein n=1 Tax=Leptospira fainei serovar Hurstbridge str. BUT 6 TaxID=1193011 RepID=S3UWN8_9LEPT|nr:hypothetical protein [Leptospira fainei]EPG73683.1 hypothetical protein LEP1GSC058_3105 [Leptospira fainei serovar Hurstbridge str. BUT 6]